MPGKNYSASEVNIRYNKEVVYDLFFRATAETLLTIARDPQHLAGVYSQAGWDKWK